MSKLALTLGILLVAQPLIGHTARNGWTDEDSAPAAPVSGRVTVLEKNNRLADDVSMAVVWLQPQENVRVHPDSVEITMSDKTFEPHVVVVPVGSVVSFPNHDPFNHNVFSRSDAGPFDLGRYDRGESASTTFRRPGIIQVYCNIHAHMSAVVVVRDSPYFAQPLGDGTFSIPAVPPGEYTLFAWHERAKEFTPRHVVVGTGGMGDIAIELDAREYEFVQHLNKFGQPYSEARPGRRY
jgi:plastocyanin